MISFDRAVLRNLGLSAAKGKQAAQRLYIETRLRLEAQDKTAYFEYAEALLDDKTLREGLSRSEPCRAPLS